MERIRAGWESGEMIGAGRGGRRGKSLLTGEIKLLNKGGSDQFYHKIKSIIKSIRAGTHRAPAFGGS